LLYILDLVKKILKFYNSTIGKKLVVATTGILFSLFLVVHFINNLIVFAGRDVFNKLVTTLEAVRPLIILIEIVLALIIFFLDVYGVKFTKPVRSFLNDVVYRVTFLASTPTRFLPQAGKDISSFFKVKEENERLKLELEKYKSLELNVEFLTDENKNLQKILETEYFNKNLSNIILAKVLVDKNSPFLKSIIVNKGSKHGAELGMAVLDKEYLVGKIVELNFTTSRVLLLSDLNSKIPVDILPNSIQSILSGTGKENGKIQYVKEETLIENENKVFTSGAGGIFKPGIPIGEIDKKQSNLEINVSFFSDFSQLRFVKLRSFSSEEN